MPRYKLSVYDPKINEFLYDKLSKLTVEQKQQLSSSELKLISTKKALRLFMTWGTLEKKLAICTKVGIQFHLIFYDNPEGFDKQLQDVYKQHRMKGLKLDNIESMRDQGIFVVGNKEVALSLSLLAQNCHSDLYYINRDFSKAKGAISIANSSNKLGHQNPLNVEYERTANAMVLLSKFIFEAKMVENQVQSDGLEMVDAMILLFMFSKAKNHVKVETIQQALDGEYKSNTVANHCSLLFTQGYLDKLPTVSRIPIYTITSKGIMFVTRIINRVTNLASNT